MTASVRTLLGASIDYAGLFPPAGLDMPSAVRNYAEYLRGDAAWALGRFVVPAARLDEFARAAAALLPAPGAGAPWRLAALAGGGSPADLDADLAAVEAFNRRHGDNRRQAERTGGAALVDVLEVRAGTPDAAGAVARAARERGSYAVYVEIPVRDDPAELLTALTAAGGRAKVRTGGVTADAFPSAGHLARFVRGCVGAGVAFKATAGLHHPLRAEYPLTYEPESPRGTMYGFLNVFLAAALARAGAGEAELTRLLEERSAGAFRFDDSGASWREHRFGLADLEAARHGAVVSFGSCSFTEPLDDLRLLGLLEAEAPAR